MWEENTTEENVKDVAPGEAAQEPKKEKKAKLPPKPKKTAEQKAWEKKVAKYKYQFESLDEEQRKAFLSEPFFSANDVANILSMYDQLPRVMQQIDGMINQTMVKKLSHVMGDWMLENEIDLDAEPKEDIVEEVEAPDIETE